MIQLMSRLVQIVSAFSLAFWSGIFGTVISVIIMSFTEKAVFPMSLLCVTMLLIHCIGATQINVIEPYCLKYVSPLVTSIIQTTHLVVLLVLQYTLLRDVLPGNQNWVEILGGVISFLTAVLGPLVHLIVIHMDEIGEKKQLLECDEVRNTGV